MRKLPATFQKTELLSLRCRFILETLTENLLGLFDAHLITPLDPVFARMPSEEFEVRAGTALLDDVVKLVGLTGMFAFPGAEGVHLPAALSPH